jgi:RNA polymerase sigma-70 factor (ECF subfamily)
VSQDHSFDDLMVRLRTGDNDAAALVFNRFAGQLIALAQRRLDHRVRRKLDAEDVLQSVFRSFFARQAADQMDDLETWDNLWAMLVVITLRKCGRRVDHFHAACRDVQREVGLQPPADRSGAGWEVASGEPTPEEAALLTDTVESILCRLDGRHREIFSLTLQGYTAPEVSAAVGCTERTVYRVLERVKDWLEQMRGDDEGGGEPLKPTGRDP